MNRNLIPQAALILSMFAFGSFYPLTKYTMAALDPLTMAFLRYFLGALPLIPFYFVERSRHPLVITGKDKLILFLLGQLGVTAFALFLFLGVDLSNASNGALLPNTQPIFTVFFAPLLIKEHFSVKRVLGAAVGFLGLLLVTTGGSLSNIIQTETFLGNLLLVGASISMTLYNIYLKSFIRRFGSLVPTLLTFLYGAIVLFLIALVKSDLMGIIFSLNLKEVLLILYIGIGATAVPYFLFNRALKDLDVVAASGFKFLIPVSGVLLSILIFRELPSLTFLLGMGIIIGSIFFLQKTY